MFRFIRQVFRGFSLVTLCALLIPVAVFVCIVGGLIFLPLPANLPDPNSTVPSQASQLYDQDGKLIEVVRRFDQNIPVQQNDIPVILKQALISSEDRGFYKDNGVDPRGALRAFVADIRNKKAVQGGSTITQQYVKLAYTNRAHSLSRKIREAILASQLDRQINKDEILYRYFSAAYFGEGAYGIGAASASYFRLPVSQLNASQAAALVGILPSPSAWALRDNPTEAETRRRLVLDEMLGQHYITVAQHDDAVAHPLWLETDGKPPGPVTLVRATEQATSQFPYFTDYVKRYLKAKYGETAVYGGGLRVQTTLDPVMQAEAEGSVANALKGTSAPLDMAMVAVEPPTGYVKALVGGRDFAKAQVNLALGGCPPRPKDGKGRLMKVQVDPTCWHESVVKGGGTGRQPGSSFKPYVLAAAYQQGITPNTSYPALSSYSPPGCTGSDCVVHNFEGEAFGSVNLKQATAESVNTVFAPLIRDIGTKHDGHVVTGFVDTANVAKNLGVTSAYYSQDFHQTNGNYALGTIDVSPLDMAAAYSVFANRGLRLPATPLLKVLDANGKVLEDNTNRTPQRVLDEAVADNVTDALKGVIEHGTGSTNGNIGRPAAGKTGTTENYTNAWFVGYTPTLSTSVWLGYSDKPRTIDYKGNTKIAGGTVPTAAWANFMKQALNDVPATEFSQPAPIKAPAKDVLKQNTGPTQPPPITPSVERAIKTTPTSSFDKTNSGRPLVVAPDVPTTPPVPATPPVPVPVPGNGNFNALATPPPSTKQ